MRRALTWLAGALLLYSALCCLGLYSLLHSHMWSHTTHDLNLTTRGQRSGCGAGEYMRREPQVLLIGAGYSRASTVLTCLTSLHHCIHAPLTEPHFFYSQQYFTAGEAAYAGLMPATCPGDVIIDKDILYLRKPGMLARIIQWKPGVKLLVCLEDPVVRAAHHFYASQQLYCQDNCTFEQVALNHSTMQLDTHLDFIKASLFNLHIKRWLKFISPHQLHIIDSHHLVQNPASELSKVETFLGLEHRIKADMFELDTEQGVYCMRGLPCQGLWDEYTEVKDTGVLRLLVEYFKPHVLELHQLIGVKLSWMDKYLS